MFRIQWDPVLFLAGLGPNLKVLKNLHVTDYLYVTNYLNVTNYLFAALKLWNIFFCKYYTGFSYFSPFYLFILYLICFSVMYILAFNCLKSVPNQTWEFCNIPFSMLGVFVLCSDCPWRHKVPHIFRHTVQ